MVSKAAEINLSSDKASPGGYSSFCRFPPVVQREPLHSPHMQWIIVRLPMEEQLSFSCVAAGHRCCSTAWVISSFRLVAHQRGGGDLWESSSHGSSQQAACARRLQRINWTLRCFLIFCETKRECNTTATTVLLLSDYCMFLLRVVVVLLIWELLPTRFKPTRPHPG